MSLNIADIRPAKVSDFDEFVDSGLRHFQNIEFTQEKLMERHQISKKHCGNAKKQATQISHCISLAREYAVAARSVTLATRPVLLYYSVLNFVRAEILAKGTGESSLDAARGEHSHHGMSRIFPSSVARSQLGTMHLAHEIRTCPVRFESGYSGTFGLWHRSAREYPVSGKTYLPDGYVQNGIVMNGDQSILPALPECGLSLVECLRMIPSLGAELFRFGVDPIFYPAKVERTFRQGAPIYHIFLYSKIEEIAAAVRQQIYFPAKDGFNLTETQSSVGYRWDLSMPERFDETVYFPNFSCVGLDDSRVCTIRPPLNEFGAYYVSLFILGNLCRYYPDW